MAEEREIVTISESADANWRAAHGPLVTGREVLWALVWSVIIVALTTLPYLWAAGQTDAGQPWAGHQFQGFMWGVDEGNVYLTWMRQASEGETLLRNQYTILPQNPSFVNAFMLAGGWLVKATGHSPGVIFHAMRVAGGIALLMSIYLLAAFLSGSRAIRWAALALASLGSGFGWLAAMWANSLPDFMPPPLLTPDYAPPPPHTWQAMPESVTFVSILLNPLFAWSMALLCLVFVTALLALERRKIGWAVLSGVILLALGNIHTYDVFVAHAALVSYILVLLVGRRITWGRALGTYGVILALSVAAPIWAWHTARLDPAWLAKINIKTLSPRPMDYAAGYGLVMLLALVGAAWTWRHKLREPKLLFPICWVVANALLVYAPVAFQRKMAEGLHIPLCILAGVGLVMAIAPRLADSSGRRRTGLVITLAVVVALPSNALFVADMMQYAGSNNIDLLHVLQPPTYLSWDEVHAIEYLGEHAAPEDVVLSSSLIGNHIPPRTRCKVVAGHWAETIEFTRMVELVGSFLLPGRGAAVRSGLLGLANADWVYYGSYEALMARQMMLAAELRPPDDPAAKFREATAEILDPVFENETVTVYRVISEVIVDEYAVPADEP